MASGFRAGASTAMRTTRAERGGSTRARFTPKRWGSTASTRVSGPDAERPSRFKHFDFRVGVDGTAAHFGRAWINTRAAARFETAAVSRLLNYKLPVVAFTAVPIASPDTTSSTLR